MTDFVPFNILLNEAEKRRQSQELAKMYENWRASGGMPTIITKSMMRMKKASKSPYGHDGAKKPPINVLIIGRVG